ncbi:MAG TPA: hypothetical protein VIM33_08780 [Gaiellaceae bacterium]
MSEHEPEQLDIADELETWEEWFATLPPLPPADDEDEQVAKSEAVFFPTQADIPAYSAHLSPCEEKRGEDGLKVACSRPNAATEGKSV